MNNGTKSIRTFLLIVALLISPRWAEAAIPEGVVQFANEYIGNYAHLIEAASREQLKEIRKQLSQGDKQRNEGKSDSEKQAGTDQITEAAAELIRVLGGSSMPVEILIEQDTAEPSFSGPHNLPGYDEALILRVVAGPGPTIFRIKEVDLSASPTTLKIDVAAEGATYIMLRLKDLPVAESILTLSLRREGVTAVQHLISIETPMTGDLDLTILSDDFGKPFPAMVRITSLRDNRDIEPSNAVELGHLFDGHARTSGHRPAHLPGKLGGEWWIVPGPLNMALAPGDYEIAIRRGAEHVPLFEEFTIEPGQTTKKTYRPRRWIDMRQEGWYSGDDHVHCQILSDDDAARVMAWIQAEDVHVANIVKMGDIFRTWFEQRGFGEEFRYIRDDFVLSPGQECPRTHQLGHTLAMATKSMVRHTEQYFLYDWFADAVHAEGGLWGFAHVLGGDHNRGGAFNVQAGMTLMYPHREADFLEIMQFGGFGPGLYYEFLNLGFKATASTGSDVPWGGTVGEARMYAHIGDEPFSADAWFEAVRAGRTFVTSGPMLELTVNDALPGDEIRVKRGEKLIVRASVRGHAARAQPQRLELIKWGEVIHSASAAKDSSGEIQVELEIDADDGFWLALRGYATNGTLAHTTPVYVKCDDLRWWNPASVNDLVEKRLKSCDEVEAMFVEARDKIKGGDIPPDQNLREMSRQAGAVLERVAQARQAYRGLQQIAREEAANRSPR